MKKRIHPSMKYSPSFMVREAVNKERIRLMDEIFSMTLKEFKKAKKDYNEAQEQGKIDNLVKLRKPLEEVLSTRVVNLFRRFNIRTLKDLTEISEEELLKFSGFGKAAIEEIKDRLEEYELSLTVK